MVKLNLSVPFASALQKRMGEVLASVDRHLADRLARSDETDPDRVQLPEERALYEQALTMLLVEVLVNVNLGLRGVFGLHGDAHLDALVADALRRTKDARDEMDGKRKAAAS